MGGAGDLCRRLGCARRRCGIIYRQDDTRSRVGAEVVGRIVENRRRQVARRRCDAVDARVVGKSNRHNKRRARRSANVPVDTICGCRSAIVLAAVGS